MKIWKSLRGGDHKAVPAAEFLALLFEFNRVDVKYLDSFITELQDAAVLLCGHNVIDSDRYEELLHAIQDSRAHVERRREQLDVLEEAIRLANTPGADAKQRLAELEPRMRAALDVPAQEKETTS